MIPRFSIRFVLIAALSAATIVPGYGQASTSKPAEAEGSRKASSYYHYSLGHLYAELAQAYGNKGDYLTKAVDNFKLAMKEDPQATFLSEELSDLYIQSGRYREAVTEAEDALRQKPDDLNARRILGRIYTRMIGDSQQGRLDEAYLKKAIEQYHKIAEAAPKDVETWLTLGQLEKISANSTESEKAYKKALELEPENEDALTGLAIIYSNLGNAQGAAELLRRVSDKNPTPRTLMALADTYAQMHEYSLAAETLRKTMQLSPGNPDVKRAFAQNLMLADQLDESLQMYRELVEEDPKDVESVLRVSQIYRQKRDLPKAREAADKAKELNPNNPEILYNDVSVLEAEGKTVIAISELKDLISATSKRSYTSSEKTSRVMLLERLGLLYRSNDQVADAADTFRKIAELDQEAAPKAEALIIDTYRLAKDYPKANKEADEAIKKYPADRVVREVRATLLADTGRTDEAISQIKKLLDGKNDREVYLSLAQLYDRTKNYGEMAKAIDAAAKLSDSKDDKENISFMRGAMYEKMKRYDAAETEFRRVLETSPNNAGALNYLGYMLADRNIRLQEAVQLISKALENDPNNGAYLDSLGWAYYRLDRLQEAETTLRRAMDDKFSKDPTVHDHLGDVLFKEGKVREAVVQWETSLKQWELTPPADQDAAESAKVQKKLESAKVRLAKEAGSKPAQ